MACADRSLQLRQARRGWRERSKPDSASGPRASTHRLRAWIGTAGLIALFACSLVDGTAWRTPRSWQWPAAMLASLLVVVHLIVSPVRLAQSAARVPDAALERVSDSMPADPTVPRQRFVIVNVPSALTVSFSFFVRAHRASRSPSTRGCSRRGQGPVSVSSVDARTLRVRWLGRQETLFRGDYRMTALDRVRSCGMDVEVTAITDDGWPTEAAFRFDTELRDPGAAVAPMGVHWFCGVPPAGRRRDGDYSVAGQHPDVHRDRLGLTLGRASRRGTPRVGGGDPGAK
jgi:hypothetical protein